MKQFFSFFFLALSLSFLFAVSTIAQPNIRNDQTIKKGHITLKNGTLFNYKKLKMETTDSVTFINSSGNIEKRSVSEIYKITKTGNFAVFGAVSCGLGAMLGALQGVNEAKSYGADTKGTGGLVVGLTLGGVAVGALIGSLIKREKTLYKATSLSFSPTINNQNHIGFNIGASFNISKK